MDVGLIGHVHVTIVSLDNHLDIGHWTKLSMSNNIAWILSMYITADISGLQLLTNGLMLPNNDISAKWDLTTLIVDDLEPPTYLDTN